MESLKKTLKKNLLLAALIVGSSLSAQAQTLAEVMQSMAAVVKSINAQAGDPAQNANSAEQALQLAALCDTAKTLTPATASDAAKKASYEQMLAASAQTARDLAKAFQAGDNAQALQLIKQLAAQKKEGHTQFK